MKKREDIHKILIIGSGPIIIGQACEFDYSGTQACKALKQLGYEIVLVNSNPATIMTDPGTADVTYIEPLNVERLTQIIEKERPDGLLPNLGGQSGLNLCSELAGAGVLEKYKVKVIGVQVDAIERGEDRVEFKKTMNSLGIGMARSEVAYTVEEALDIAESLGYPVVIRPAYTMGGAGGGLVYNVEELKTVVARGLQASLVGQVLVEESVLGWEELELEVVRDATGKMITVCFIENIDPMGVHTGDSFCAAPMLTISKAVQKELQRQAYKIVDAIQVIGGTNVQFAHDPKSGRIVVIEINPRTSRSSALASKATGFPIALVSAMLATGLNLSDIPCGKYGTLDQYVPEGNYVVIKFARWAFEKFKGSEDKLGTQMKAVGEVMSIGKTYKEAFQKAIRSLETGRYGLGYARDFASNSKQELLNMLHIPTSERQFIMYEALRKGATVDEIHELTKIKHYFIEQMEELVLEEEALKAYRGDLPPAAALRSAKLNGFSDRYIAGLLKLPEETVRRARYEAGIREAWESIHVSGTKDAAYYYSTYHLKADKSPCSNRPKVMILGGGPNRIGQGIEFDYCCVHAAFALKELGFETIIVNCNPETVSTDYDTSDKLYFEPLTLEDVLSIYEKEKPLGVIAQFGGQTPLNLAAELKKYGVTILGTTPETIDLAEDRDQFREMMEKLNIPMPESGMAVILNRRWRLQRESVTRLWYGPPMYWAAGEWRSYMMMKVLRFI
jgi:carbamoyl-phosphate synthase large subunit